MTENYRNNVIGGFVFVFIDLQSESVQQKKYL